MEMDLSSVLRRLENREATLAPFACRAASSKGRAIPEAPCPLRTDFQRDRDRILHTNAFRRLKHKTQVFIAPVGDHYVTRLTHTLEVTQVARTVGRALNLNEDLVEAIGLGHDLGHTPFGHVGEATLARLRPEGFHHSQQSLRVVERLAREGQGLNLTWEVRRGIVSHSKPRGDFLTQPPEGELSLEAQVVRLCDAVAYVNHDIGDAIRAGLLSEPELPSVARNVLGTSHSKRINTLISDIVSSSWSVSRPGLPNDEALPRISMSSTAGEALLALREFLFQRVYIPAGQGQDGTIATTILEFLYSHLCDHPNQVPLVYRNHGVPSELAATDYIAGMTDHYALRLAEQLRPGLTQGMLQWHA